MAIQQVPDEEDLAGMAAVGGKGKKRIFEPSEREVAGSDGMWG